MTNEERSKVIKLRSEGYGYKRIAQLTEISVDTIKAFCRRNNLAGMAPEACPYCGKMLIRTPGKKPKKFCSDSCRNKWWNAHLSEVKRKAIYEFTCAYCKKPFTAYGNSKRKYCCHACYIADRYGRLNDD